MCTKETDNQQLNKKISKLRRTVYSLEMWAPLHKHHTCPPLTRTSPILPTSLLLRCHQEGHDTAGKETGSLWDLLLTLLQCNGPPSSRTSLQGAGADGHQPHGPPHRSSGSGRAEGSGARPALSASLQIYPPCRVFQMSGEFAWWRTNCNSWPEHAMWLLTPVLSWISLCPVTWSTDTEDIALHAEQQWRRTQPLLFHCLVSPSKGFLDL